MKNTGVILYPAGAYGHFISWCCDYFSGLVPSHDVPVNDLGNCHLYSPYPLLLLAPSFKEYTESDLEYSFVHIHESSFDPADVSNMGNSEYLETLTKNLEYLQTHYKKSICVLPSASSIIWYTNNNMYKIRVSDWFSNMSDEGIRKYYQTHSMMSDDEIEELIAYGDDRVRYQLKSSVDIQAHLNAWGHDNINDFAVWELRELASKYYVDKMMNSLISPETISLLSDRFPSIKFVLLDQLRDNFKDAIHEILTHFDVSIQSWDRVDSIHDSWIKKQVHIHKDRQVVQIVDALIESIDLDWSDWQLSLVDTICIQRKLSDRGIEIKCHNLNEFPTNTKDFLPLLEKIN